MPSTHILHDFDEAMKRLRSSVLTMAGVARDNLHRALQALMERDIQLANAVIADDDEVDGLERTIDELCMEILVRFHPMAVDLRTVISSMKISQNLERISDHATTIAKRARKLAGCPELPEVSLVEPVYCKADELLRDAIEAYNEHNPELGAALHARDKELDRVYKDAAAKFSARIEQSVERGQDYIHLILVLRSLERIGDLSVNIGEDAVFAERARDIRHEKDRGI